MSEQTEHTDPDTGEVSTFVPALRDASPSIGQLAPALAKAQGAVAAVQKSSSAHVVSREKDTEYTYAYADLSAIRDACRKALADNGLSVLHRPLDRKLETTLLHESTEWLRSEWPLFTRGNGPQDYGSALTYARRYSEMALLGLAPEDDGDDDGAAAQRSSRGRGSNSKRNRSQSRSRAQSPEAKQATRLGELTARYVAEFGKADNVHDLKRIAGQVEKIEFGDGHAARLKQAYDERAAELGDEAAE